MAMARLVVVAKCAACALGNISAQRSEWSDEVSAAGAIPLLIALLQEGPSSLAAGDAANCLGNVANRYENQEAIREGGGLQPLVPLLQLGSGNESALLAARAVFAVCEGPNVANCEVMRAAGAIPPLTELLKESKGNSHLASVASNALLALADASQSNIDEIRKAGGINALVMCLDDVKDADPVSLTGGLWAKLLHPTDDVANENMLRVAAEARAAREAGLDEDELKKRKVEEEKKKKASGR